MILYNIFKRKYKTSLNILHIYKMEDKNKQVKELVDKINNENVEKYGELCENCEIYKTFCRCELSTYVHTN